MLNACRLSTKTKHPPCQAFVTNICCAKVAVVEIHTLPLHQDLHVNTRLNMSLDILLHKHSELRFLTRILITLAHLYNLVGWLKTSTLLLLLAGCTRGAAQPVQEL